MNPQDQAYTAQGLRFWVQDKENAKVRVLVVYSGAVPDAFKATREVVMTGTRRGTTFVANPGTMITKCPSKYQSAVGAIPVAELSAGQSLVGKKGLQTTGYVKPGSLGPASAATGMP